MPVFFVYTSFSVLRQTYFNDIGERVLLGFSGIPAYFVRSAAKASNPILSDKNWIALPYIPRLSASAVMFRCTS